MQIVCCAQGSAQGLKLHWFTKQIFVPNTTKHFHLSAGAARGSWGCMFSVCMKPYALNGLRFHIKTYWIMYKSTSQIHIYKWLADDLQHQIDVLSHTRAGYKTAFVINFLQSFFILLLPVLGYFCAVCSACSACVCVGSLRVLWPLHASFRPLTAGIRSDPTLPLTSKQEKMKTKFSERNGIWTLARELPDMNIGKMY